MAFDFDTALERMRERHESGYLEQAVADELDAADAEYDRRVAECNDPDRVANTKRKVQVQP